jgi:hypothetical protein
MQLMFLKELVAEELTRLPVDRLKLILGGKVLTDGPLSLGEGGKRLPACSLYCQSKRSASLALALYTFLSSHSACG